MPTDSISPIIDRRLMVSPRKYMTTRVMSSDVGIDAAMSSVTRARSRTSAPASTAFGT